MNRRSASLEVRSKTDAQIERETAGKWAARAIACYQEHARTGKQSWLLRATSYRDEAIEHAALVGDSGRTVKTIQAEIDRVR